MDRDGHIQYFDLHQEGARFLSVAEAAKINSQVFKILQGV